MMRNLSPRLALALIVVSGVTAAVDRSPAAEKSTAVPIKLERVAIGAFAILQVPGEPVLGLLIESKASAPVRLSVKVRAPEPNAECERGFFLDPGKDTLVACPQQSIVADGEYTISIAVFDKVTAGTTMSSMFGIPKGDGTLSVESSGVTYRTKKETVSIPASQIRSVELNEADPKQPWVVVGYEEAGATKVVSFKPNVYRSDPSASLIVLAIRSAMQAAPGK